MSAIKTESQSPKETTVDELLDNVSHFIDNVYRDLARSQESDSSFNSSMEAAGATGGAFLEENQNQTTYNAFENVLEDQRRRSATATRRRNLDADIERINRICRNVDESLQNIGIFVNDGGNGANTNTRRGRGRSRLSQITENIDLNRAIRQPPQPVEASNNEITVISEDVNAPQTPIAVVVPDDDDEVVVVSSSLPPVIDLCTPNNDVIPYRRSQVNRNELSRRNLERSEEIQHEVPIPIRRRRVSKPTPPPELDLSSEPEASAESSGESLDHTPFMCPVCMESCLKRKPTSTKCGHVFCEHCIKQSIRLTHKCPMCKTKLSCNQLIRIYV